MILSQQGMDCQGEPDVEQAAGGHHRQRVEEAGDQVEQSVHGESQGRG